MSMRTVTVAIILLCGMAAASAAAAERSERFSATFSTTGTTRLEGQLDLDWQAAGLSVRQAETGDVGQLMIRGDRLTAKVVNIPQERIVANPPVLQRMNFELPGPEEDGPSQVVTGDIHVSFDSSNPQQEVRVVPTQTQSFVLQDLRSVGLQVAPAGSYPPDNVNSSFSAAQHIDGVVSHPLPPFFQASIEGGSVANTTGSMVVFVAGPTVVLPDGTKVHTGRELNLSRSAVDPMTKSGRYVYDNRILVIRGDAVQLAPAGVGMSISARKADGHLEGRGAWHGLKGESNLANSTLPAAQDTLNAAGSFEVHAWSSSHATEWQVEGVASSLLVNLVPLLQQPAALVGGAAVGLTLLALLLGEQLRSGLTFVLGRSTPGILKARPLKSRTRRAILEIIHEHQPVTFAHLQEATGYARGTLRYHLRVLSSCELLQALLPTDQAKKNITYALNSNSLLFKTEGIGTLPGKEVSKDLRPGKVLACINSSPVRRAIYDHLLEHGEADLDAIRSHVLGRGLASSWPRSTASHQLRVLENARAIVSIRRNRKKVYAANLDPKDARARQYAHYLESHGFAWLAERLHANGSMTLEELWSAQENSNPGSRQQLRHDLEHLTAAAFISYDATTRRYRLERPLASLAPQILERLNPR